MRCIQTFWTRDVPEEQLFSIAAGWRTAEYHWMSWALSCLQIEQVLGHTELVTDSKGKYILHEVFQLPYKNVSIQLDTEMAGCPADAWALAKIFAYQSQRQPFLHFDSDFYLWAKPGENILAAQVVAQNLEKDLPFYKDALEALHSHLSFIPPAFTKEAWKDQSIYAYNAGIFGGTNLRFIHGYCDQAIRFVERNKSHFGFREAANLNFVFEQFFLKHLADEQGVPVTCLSNHVQEDPFYGTFLQFADLPRVPFIHPVGGHKKNSGICDHVASQLRMRYPDYYRFLLDVLNRQKQLASIRVFPVSGTVQKVNIINPATIPAEGYSRTIAALRHIGEQPAETSNLVTIISSPGQDNNSRNIKHEITGLQISKHQKKWLTELFTLEFAKQKLYRAVFIKSKLSRLYEQECRNYSDLQQEFAKPRTAQALSFIQNPHLRLVTVSKNWICKLPELVPQMVTERFAEDKIQKTKMSLVPHITRAEIDEYYLEPIDLILVSLCKEERSLSWLIEEMSAYFPEEEITIYYESYCGLIENTVKHLSYLQILVPADRYQHKKDRP